MAKASNPPIRKPIRAALMRHFEQAPGIVHYIQDLETALGDTADRIVHGISNLRREVNFPVETVVAGHAWKYVPPSVREQAAPGKRVFEELAVTKDGRVLIQDSDGAVYAATEM